MGNTLVYTFFVARSKGVQREILGPQDVTLNLPTPRSTGPGDVQQLVNLSIGNGGIYRYTIMIPE